MKKIVIAMLVGASLFGFNSINAPVANVDSNGTGTYYNTYALQGKVIKAYIAPGYGVRKFDWLFMDVETSKGVTKVGIAPTFIISNLPIKEGDIVKINGITPPVWPQGSMRAWDVYDVTQKKDYPIAGYGRGGRGYGRRAGWRWQ